MITFPTCLPASRFSFAKPSGVGCCFGPGTIDTEIGRFNWRAVRAHCRGLLIFIPSDNLSFHSRSLPNVGKSTTIQPSLSPTPEKTESLYPVHRVLPNVDFSGRDSTVPAVPLRRVMPDIYSAGHKQSLCRSDSIATGR